MTFYDSNAAAIAKANASVDRLDLGTTNASGRIRIYSGTVPADADASLGAAVLLAELVMSNPAYGNAVDINPGARATASAISDDTAADAGGTPSFYRAVDRDAVAVHQGTVGVGSGDLQINASPIVINAIVSITSLTYTQPEG
jgi:hypothetical protein